MFRAVKLMAIGTILVLLFSDPAVDILSEMAERLGVDAFYVAFVLAPMASNASEMVAAYNYAAKKTQQTIIISLGALEGAACMNNTYCLAVFMGIVFFRGVTWTFTAETLSIVFVEIGVAFMAFKRIQTLLDGFMILSLYPLSLLLVYFLENVVGLD